MARSTLPAEGILQAVHDERTQTLASLVEQNHATYGLLYNGVMHNHTQHVLIASYLLGSDADALKMLYEDETAHTDLVPWGDRPTSRIQTEDDFNAHLGDLAYERDFVAYFENEPKQHGEWKAALRYHLFNSHKPLLTGLVGGFAHPWLMLADAVELGSGTLAMDALALVAVDYSPLSKLLKVSLPDSSPDSNTSLSALFESVHTDTAFDGIVQHIGIQSASAVLADRGAREAVIEYLGRFANIYSFYEKIDQLDTFLKQFVNIALDLIAATSVPGAPPAFDFYLAHTLSFCNCVRILLPLVDNDEQHKAMLFRMLWLMTLLPYITQQRPTITAELIKEEEVRLSWDEIKRAAVDANDKRTTDPHFVKMLQLLSIIPDYWPELGNKALHVANKTIRSFVGWRGFGVDVPAVQQVKHAGLSGGIRKTTGGLDHQDGKHNGRSEAQNTSLLMSVLQRQRVATNVPRAEEQSS